MEKCKFCGKECKDKKGIATHIRLTASCQEKYLIEQQQKQIEYDNTHTFVYCEICGQKLRNISNTHLKKHGISQQDYKKQFPLAKLFADGLLEEQTEKREKTLNKYYTDKNGKRTHYLTLDKCIKKYGQEEGLRIWNEHKAKYGLTLNNLIAKYGEEIGIKKYNEYCQKRRGKRTLEYFINKYGKQEGEKQYKKYRDKYIGFQTLDWYVKRHGEKQGTELYKKSCINKALTLDNFIKKYGYEDGQKKYYEYYNNKFFGFRQSKMALELFNRLMQFDKLQTHQIWFYNHPKEYGKYLHELNKYVFFDFFDETTGKIIEFNGDYWHANPLFYEADSVIYMPNKTMKIANDIWQQDKARDLAIKNEYGYQIFYIWENEWNMNKDFIYQKCIDFLIN